jgi:hypothetical protein
MTVLAVAQITVLIAVSIDFAQGELAQLVGLVSFVLLSSIFVILVVREMLRNFSALSS